jgi:endoglucanase
MSCAKEKVPLLASRRQILGLALAGLVPFAACADAGFAWRRARALGPGVNFSRWWDRNGGESAPERWVPRRAAFLGFGHVRLPVPPEKLMLEEVRVVLSRHRMDVLARDVGRILSEGLSVIVDIHPTESFKVRLFAEPGLEERFTAFWYVLAKSLSRFDPDRVLLEVLNEPGGPPDPRVWQAMQGRLVSTIRAGAQEHTIVACGAGPSSIGDLGALAPYGDPNVVYSFHFYSPMIFTHQGAAWSGRPFDRVRNVPFPLSIDTIKAVANELTSVEDRTTVRREALSQRDWDQAAIAALAAEAGDWSALHGRPVICTEFGAFRDGGAPRADRIRYIAAVRQALDSSAAAWSHWDYSGGFGVLERRAGWWRPDEEVLGALGLRFGQSNEGR